MQVYPLFIWLFARLFGTLSFARRYFRSKKQKKNEISFVFYSLIRTFAPKF